MLPRFIVFLPLLLVAVQAKYEFPLSKVALDCAKTAGTDEETIRSSITEKGIITENDEKMEKFFECCFGDHITDNNELVADDKLEKYVGIIFTNRLRGREKLGKLLAKECMEECKATKGDTKGKTGVKTLNCLMEKLNEYIDKPAE